MAKKKTKFLSALLAVIMLLSMMPVSVFAAPASDLPANMVDSPILRALEYTGYDVQKQKDDGTLYQSGSYGNRTPADVLSNIHYGTATSGKETVADSSTSTGKAPNIARFEQYGLCCAGFVTYYLCNYLPNIEGADMDYIIDAIDATGLNSQAAVTWQRALNNLVSEGIVEKIGTSSSNVDREKLTPGDIIMFGNDTSATAHIAIYSGTYNGTDFIIHVGNDRGPEILPVKWISDASNGEKASYPNGYYHLPEVLAAGTIEVYKKDTNGNSLAGAYFVATSTSDPELQYVIGPTNSSGYASVDGVIFSTYTVKETVFPEGYRAHGQTEWTVTLDKNTPDGTITINAVNEQIPGSCEIIKHSEDGKTDGITFRIVGEGVDKTGVTNGGKVLFSALKPGTYTVSEIVPDTYEPQNAKTVTVVSGQTAKVTFSNTLKKGSIVVTKDAEDGLEVGAKFHLYGTTDSGIVVDEYAIVGNDKKAYFNDIPIGSRLTLEEVEVASYYITPDDVQVTVLWNEATNITVENILKKGDLHVVKDAEDGLPQGSRFHLYGISDSGVEVDEYAPADSNGDVWFRNIPISTKLTLEEVDVATRYVIPDKETVSILWNEVTEITVKNILKKWRADVFKVDKDIAGAEDKYAPVDMMPMVLTLESDNMVDELGSPYGEKQGDATLEGAKYGLYKGEVLVDVYTTDKNGWFITDYYPCGDDWTLRELESSEGYLVDPTVYPIFCYEEQYSVELNTEYVDVYEEVIKGRLVILKHTDDGSTQIETPEAGAKFEVFLKSAGSYESAKEDERGVLVCDDFGGAVIELPYGVYTMKQVSGWEGKELMSPFDVYIKEDGEVYFYLINNATFAASVEIQKQDAETGKIIPAAGIGFRVRNTDTGEYVVQHVNYPTPTDVEVYYTDSTGKLMLPEKLPYGNYEIIEERTCYGYVLNGDPVPFKVDGTLATVTVVKSNMAQKGTITVTKTGEVFSKVTEENGLYQPVYEIDGLSGTVYEITASEDIYTLDGTLRYAKGDLVDTITTGSDGIAVSKPLYLGKFLVTEIQSAYGMVLNSEPALVELTYAGEQVSVTNTSVGFVNERQKVIIDLAKTLETDDLFGIGNGDEILSVKFALYAAEDIYAADGGVIPKDGLIEIAGCDASGKFTFATDLPVGTKVYVREYAVDEHYILSDNVYSADFVYAGQDVAEVKISINDGAEIINTIIRGSVLGKKVDEDGFAVADARFGLFAPETTEFTEENALMLCDSNEIGIFLFEGVPFGTWLVKELKSAPAFVLNEMTFEVKISENEQVVEIEAENKFIVGSVQVTKVDADYPDNKLSDAVFEYYVDVDGNKIFDSDIDLLVGELTEIEAGVYRAEGLRYNGYFLHEKQSPVGFKQDTEYHYFEISTNGETVTVETKAGVGFINQPIKGNILILKKDADTGEALSGVEFGLFDMNGQEIARGTTDTDGKLLFEGIRYGQIEIRELTAKTGYYKDEVVIVAEITEDGTTLTYEIENQKIPPEPDVPDSPQTGDNSKLGLWFGLMILSLLSAVGLILYGRKGRKFE